MPPRTSALLLAKTRCTRSYPSRAMLQPYKCTIPRVSVLCMFCAGDLVTCCMSSSTCREKDRLCGRLRQYRALSVQMDHDSLVIECHAWKGVQELTHL